MEKPVNSASAGNFATHKKRYQTGFQPGLAALPACRLKYLSDCIMEKPVNSASAGNFASLVNFPNGRQNKLRDIITHGKYGMSLTDKGLMILESRK